MATPFGGAPRFCALTQTLVPPPVRQLIGQPSSAVHRFASDLFLRRSFRSSVQATSPTFVFVMGDLFTTSTDSEYGLSFLCLHVCQPHSGRRLLPDGAAPFGGTATSSTRDPNCPPCASVDPPPQPPASQRCLRRRGIETWGSAMRSTATLRCAACEGWGLGTHLHSPPFPR